MRGFPLMALAAGVALLPGLAAAEAAGLDALRGDGQYDAVTIAGFTLPLEDVERLVAQGVMTFDAEAGRFAFGPDIGSERQLRHALRQSSDIEARAVADLYRANKVALPNGAAQTLTVPSGYGPAIFSNQRGGVSFGVAVGGVSRVPYTDEPDGGLSLGVGFGNAFETVGVSLGLAINDLSDPGNTDRYSAAFQVSRYLWDGLSVAVGGENLAVAETDGQESYYGVGSWAFDPEHTALPFAGVATLGVGSGRFSDMTERDLAEGKPNRATGVFGAISVEVTPSANFVADWNGRNLTVGGAFLIPGTGISVRLGVRDLTGNSGDGPRLTGSAGLTLVRF
ncbi:hypothetical protein [Tropicimonas sediminicola]|uniref:Uncharacterized protein n=1 Tax=Tropicimonas sediminicola TaxID=1031541 RepID=A0A239JRR2_9RHOB|nr:hypothetical protein [Tropicimonas sediminicola]SNT08520.1 hypothetical protein SAMN05421757_10634 [Tropicimonas sediminicola]